MQAPDHHTYIAHILIRRFNDGVTERWIGVTSLDEAHVDKQIAKLKRKLDKTKYFVDDIEVEDARVGQSRMRAKREFR